MSKSARIAWLLPLLLIAAPAARPQAATPAQAGTLRIYLARHGETDWNTQGRIQGWTDTPLNATGREQAIQLKSRLIGIPLDAAYSSTLSRSRETAELAYGAARLSRLPELRERNMGKYQGQVTSDPQIEPEYNRRRWTPDDSLDGGESLNVFEQRVGTAIARIRREHPGGNVLVVGHGFTNQMILKQLFNLNLDQTRGITQANDELYLIELQQGTAPRLWKLIAMKNLTDL
jgi:probable phosphoglycerate mutase